MLKGVIFDMDGTITLTEPFHHRAFAAVLKEFDIPFTFEEEISEYAGSGSKTLFTEVFKKHGKPQSPEVIEACIAKKKKLYDEIVHAEDIPVVTGAHDFVKKIHADGLKKIIATGNSNLDAVHYTLRKIELLDFFPFIVSIAEVAHGKPAPDVFLEAASRIGCTPAESVVLEDAVNGVAAAASAGIRCIALETTTPEPLLRQAGAAYVVKDYTYITPHMLYGTDVEKRSRVV